jgi:D-threo-aldose 1-dehydrogenase
VRKLIIPGTELETSRFIFGTGSLLRVGSVRARRRLLDAAVHHGFLHFDTAPYYGFGIAECDLAPVLRANRTVKVTTKVGIYSPGGESQSSVSVLIRKVGGRLFPALSRPTSSFELGRARRCLESSLRRLGRDHIDLYLLHEPELQQIDTSAWLDWLDSLKKSGQIGHYGLALTADRLKPFLAAQSALAEVVQVPDSLADREANVLAAHGRSLQITYGYVSGARARGDQTPVPQLLQLATRRNPHGPIVVGTTRFDRVSQYVQLPEA